MSHPHERPHDNSPSSANMLHIAQASLPDYDPSEIAPDRLSYFQYSTLGGSQPDIPDDARKGSTDIFNVLGRPDLLVRGNEGDEITMNDMRRVDQAMSAARTAGIPIVPFDYFETDGGYTRVVVPRLDGTSLNEALSKPTPGLVAEVDSIWSAHSRYYSTQDAKGEAFSSDISTAGQYMFAFMPGDSTPRIWMADIGIHTHTKGETLYQEFYLQELASTALAIVELEATLGTQLPQSRQNLLAALAIAEAGSPYYRGLKRASEYMLINSVAVDFHDESELPKQFIY